MNNDQPNKIRKKRRKKNKFFDVYISRTLKNMSFNTGITLNAKQQLNSILCIIARIISCKTRNLIELSNKKTITEKAICNALKLVLPEQICKNIKMGDVTFPQCVCEKFLRNFGYSKVMISRNAPIYLACCIEYLAFKILEKSYIQSTNGTITIQDMELGVKNNTDLNKFFIQNKLYFLDSDCLTFNKLSFEKLVRKIIIDEQDGTTIKISKDVFIVVQYFVEQKLIQLLQHANFVSNRDTLMAYDIKFIVSLYENSIHEEDIHEDIEQINEEDIEVE